MYTNLSIVSICPSKSTCLTAEDTGLFEQSLVHRKRQQRSMGLRNWDPSVESPKGTSNPLENVGTPTLYVGIGVRLGAHFPMDINFISGSIPSSILRSPLRSFAGSKKIWRCFERSGTLRLYAVRYCVVRLFVLLGGFFLSRGNNNHRIFERPIADVWLLWPLVTCRR